MNNCDKCSSPLGRGIFLSHTKENGGKVYKMGTFCRVCEPEKAQTKLLALNKK